MGLIADFDAHSWTSRGHGTGDYAEKRMMALSFFDELV
jgi:hypothetical protein